MEYKIEIYLTRECVNDEYYFPFTAVCSFEEMSYLMNFALERGYIFLVSLPEEETNE